MFDTIERVYVSPATDFGRMIDVGVFRERGDESTLGIVDDTGIIVFTGETYKDGKILSRPTLRLTIHQSRALLKALLDNGVRAPLPEAAEAELRATKYHLEDMRKMLKVHKP